MLCCAARLSAVVLCCAGLCYAALPLVRFMRSGRLLCRPFCRVSLCCLWRLLWHFPATERSREKANSGAEGARKTMSKGSEHVRNMCPETRAKEPPEAKNDSKIAPKSIQNGSKMAPWRPLGGLWGHCGRLRAPSWLARGLRRPPGSVYGGILDAFLMIFEGFLHLSPPSFFDEIPGRSLERFPPEFVVFVPRENGRQAKFAIPSE